MSEPNLRSEIETGTSVPALHGDHSIPPTDHPVPQLKLVFDRGTVLVHETPADAGLARDFPGALWDPRVQAYRLPAFKYHELKQELHQRKVSFTGQVWLKNPPPGPWGQVDLRGYQEAALVAWQLAGQRGLVVLPTGAGKTRLALAAMARTRLTALCLVPTRVLLHQWRMELAKVYKGPIGCYGDGARELAPITVVTFESAYRHMAQLGNRFELLVIDEAHHFGCGLRDEALEMALANARLGLTATPPHQSPAAEKLTSLIGPTVFELAIGDLTGSYLAAYDLFVVHLELDPHERAAYEADIGAFRTVHARFFDMVPGASWAQFMQSSLRNAEGRKALEAWRRARRLLGFTRAKSEALGSLLSRHRDARVLIFTADNPTAYKISRQHLVMPLTCDIERQEREAVLSQFQKGELKALVSSRVLNEGLDVPDADVAIIVGGAMGEREHVQRIGRLLRPSAGKKAVVYELVTRGTIEVRQGARRRVSLGSRAIHPAQYP